MERSLAHKKRIQNYHRYKEVSTKVRRDVWPLHTHEKREVRVYVQMQKVAERTAPQRKNTKTNLGINEGIQQ